MRRTLAAAVLFGGLATLVPATQASACLSFVHGLCVARPCDVVPFLHPSSPACIQ